MANLAVSPSPFGSVQTESWGEGPVMECNPPYLLPERAEERKGGESSLFGYSLGPHPNPLPKGEGVYLSSPHTG